MKNLTLMLAAFFMLGGNVYSQKLDCENICTVEKTVYEGALLGVKFGCKCGKEDKAGANIVEVVANSSADRASLKIDDIILSIDDIKVTKRSHAINAIKKKEPFQNVTITFSRNNEVKSVNAVLGARSSYIVHEEVCCDTSVDLFSEENISVYPNPTVKDLNIAFKKIEAGTYSFEVFNSNGTRLLESTDLIKKGVFSKKLNVEDFDNGVYILKVTKDNNTYSSLFAVKK